MRRKNVKKLVFVSSSSVYGEPEEIPIDENAPIRPDPFTERVKQHAKHSYMPTQSSTE
jgi:UDP-glucose 4-epimerase